MEAKKGAEVIYIRPDPLHVWYASFTVCQTLRMWSCVFDECENVFDRVLALRALEFFQQTPSPGRGGRATSRNTPKTTRFWTFFAT